MSLPSAKSAAYIFAVKQDLEILGIQITEEKLQPGIPGLKILSLPPLLGRVNQLLEVRVNLYVHGSIWISAGAVCGSAKAGRS